jgi:hypothetical protein
MCPSFCFPVHAMSFQAHVRSTMIDNFARHAIAVLRSVALCMISHSPAAASEFFAFPCPAVQMLSRLEYCKRFMERHPTSNSRVGREGSADSVGRPTTHLQSASQPPSSLKCPTSATSTCSRHGLWQGATKDRVTERDSRMPRGQDTLLRLPSGKKNE